ncbi:hypothetical protein [Lactobacillus sp. 3B(2020)]|uniref:hypothetical protein n=1 Tax=Lactobacillus sp. 3B(2020) TaxID=2695882 RepID=UPI0015E046BF|nr:hypothetical protein [Lactobacillus sp. 3B(2020)]QLL70242.1 hypothetical protein GTO83_06685 [Lactobacillus sp. 3B(2020)]
MAKEKITISGDKIKVIIMDVLETLDKYKGTEIITVASALYTLVLLMAKDTDTDFEGLNESALDAAKQVLKLTGLDK